MHVNQKLCDARQRPRMSLVHCAFRGIPPQSLSNKAGLFPPKFRDPSKPIPNQYKTNPKSTTRLQQTKPEAECNDQRPNRAALRNTICPCPPLGGGVLCFSGRPCQRNMVKIDQGAQHICEGWKTRMEGATSPAILAKSIPRVNRGVSALGLE